jgi:hypothetical protein
MAASLAPLQITSVDLMHPQSEALPRIARASMSTLHEPDLTELGHLPSSPCNGPKASIVTDLGKEISASLRSHVEETP